MFESIPLLGRVVGRAAPKPAAAVQAAVKPNAGETAAAEDDEEDTSQTGNGAAAEDEEDTPAGGAAEDGEDEEAETEDDEEAAEEDEEDEMSAAASAEASLGAALAGLPKDQRRAARNIAGLAALAATARVAAIVRSPAAEGRQAAALTLALESQDSAKACIAVLEKLPKDAGKGGLAAAMAASKQPQLGPGGRSSNPAGSGLTAAVDEINAKQRRQK
ncbi:MAG: hypothetical protein Kow00114_27080 [Kiloniellaceae bacterium]